MVPDYNRASRAKETIEAYGFQLREEVIGYYRHIIQTYIANATWDNAENIKREIDSKYDTECTLWNEGNMVLLEAQFYPIYGG